MPVGSPQWTLKYDLDLYPADSFRLAIETHAPHGQTNNSHVVQSSDWQRLTVALNVSWEAMVKYLHMLVVQSVPKSCMARGGSQANRGSCTGTKTWQVPCPPSAPRAMLPVRSPGEVRHHCSLALQLGC